jgi:hypothetical protein
MTRPFAYALRKQTDGIPPLCAICTIFCPNFVQHYHIAKSQKSDIIILVRRKTTTARKKWGVNIMLQYQVIVNEEININYDSETDYALREGVENAVAEIGSEYTCKLMNRTLSDYFREYYLKEIGDDEDDYIFVNTEFRNLLKEEFSKQVNEALIKKYGKNFDEIKENVVNGIKED